MFIIGMSLLYSCVMSCPHISQSSIQWIVSLELSRWVLLAAMLLVVLGFFLPPASIISMPAPPTPAPIILPPLETGLFDLIRFDVIVTIVMELGLIHPPAGLNILVIESIAPDLRLLGVVWGALPFVVLMIFAVIVLSMLLVSRPGWRTR
jgi:TRAP-type C4-dicarboxylate transport system permease large subunit